MLRNLLYSLFFHIIFVALIVLSSTNFNTEILETDITPLTISFLNDNTIEDLKEIKTKKEDEKVKDLSIEEKIDLYNKIKNLKNTKKNDKVIYEKSDKASKIKKDERLLNASEENEFSYYYTPIYVTEEKVNTEEKKRLVENRIRREELRKKMKEKNIIPEVNVSDIKQMQKLEDIIKISQKPLIVKKKEDKKEKEIKKEVEKEVVVAGTIINTVEPFKIEEEQKSDNLDELVDQINRENNVIDEKFNGVTEDSIFNEEDYQKLKDIEENKEDTKYMLSLREKRNIQRQIKGCYKMAILRSKNDSKAIVGLTLKVGQDGIIEMNSIKVNKIVDNFDTKGFNIALENAKSALVFCSPLRGLPIAKYKMWKQMTFVFDSNNLE